jgi:hypothetical protein
MGENARVAWKAIEEPWKLEEKLISNTALAAELGTERPK